MSPKHASALVLPPQKVDRSLILGAVLFGVGWGATGFCPALPRERSCRAIYDLALACLLGVVLGVHAADALKQGDPGQSATFAAPLNETLLPTSSKLNGPLL